MTGRRVTQQPIMKALSNAEVFAHLVVAAVFKTVGRLVKPVASGFDSHTLPPFFPQVFLRASMLVALSAQGAAFPGTRAGAFDSTLND